MVHKLCPANSLTKDYRGRWGGGFPSIPSIETNSDFIYFWKKKTAALYWTGNDAICLNCTSETPYRRGSKNRTKKIVKLRLVSPPKHVAIYANPNRRWYQYQIKGINNVARLRQCVRPKFPFVLNYISVFRPHLISETCDLLICGVRHIFLKSERLCRYINIGNSVCLPSSHRTRNMSSHSMSMKWWQKQ